MKLLCRQIIKKWINCNNFGFASHRIKGGRKQVSPMDTKLRQMYDAIRDYREPKANRQLALIFMKLPSKSVSFDLQ